MSDTTRSAYRLQYNHGRVIIRTRRDTVEIAHRLADTNDRGRYIPVLNAEQRATIEALGARNRIDYYVLPLDQAATVLALAAEFWGEPTDTDGYPMPAPEQPATEPEQAPAETRTEPATETDAAQAAARIIYEHGNTLYAALQDYMAATPQRFPSADPAVIDADREETSRLAEHILDVMGALSAPDRWSIATVAEHIGASTTGSARKTLSRWGVKPVAREAGQAGQSLYDPEQVRAAAAARPGRGARTDLGHLND